MHPLRPRKRGAARGMTALCGRRMMRGWVADTPPAAAHPGGFAMNPSIHAVTALLLDAYDLM
jgi:hypothetical protein